MNTITPDINPKDLAPALEYNGKALYEYLILCEFLEDLYPSKPPHLLPSDPYDRVSVRLWVDHITKRIIPAFFRVLQSQEREKQDDAHKELYDALKDIAKKRKGPLFLGEELSLRR